MGDIKTDSLVVPVQVTENVTTALKQIASAASEGVTLGIAMESDAGKVISDIQKISKELEKAINGKNFDMDKLFNLNNAIVKLGELQHTVDGLDVVFDTLTSSVTSLNGAMTEIASIKMDTKQFSAFQNALSSINANVEKIVQKLDGIGSSGMQKVANGAKEAAAEIKHATKATEELKQAQEKTATTNTSSPHDKYMQRSFEILNRNLNAAKSHIEEVNQAIGNAADRSNDILNAKHLGKASTVEQLTKKITIAEAKIENLKKHAKDATGVYEIDLKSQITYWKRVILDAEHVMSRLQGQGGLPDYKERLTNLDAESRSLKNELDQKKQRYLTEQRLIEETIQKKKKLNPDEWDKYQAAEDEKIAEEQRKQAKLAEESKLKEEQSKAKIADEIKEYKELSAVLDELLAKREKINVDETHIVEGVDEANALDTMISKANEFYQILESTDKPTGEIHDQLVQLANDIRYLTSTYNSIFDNNRTKKLNNGNGLGAIAVGVSEYDPKIQKTQLEGQINEVATKMKQADNRVQVLSGGKNIETLLTEIEAQKQVAQSAADAGQVQVNAAQQAAEANTKLAVTIDNLKAKLKELESVERSFNLQIDRAFNSTSKHQYAYISYRDALNEYNRAGMHSAPGWEDDFARSKIKEYIQQIDALKTRLQAIKTLSPLEYMTQYTNMDFRHPQATAILNGAETGTNTWIQDETAELERRLNKMSASVAGFYDALTKHGSNVAPKIKKQVREICDSIRTTIDTQQREYNEIMGQDFLAKLPEEARTKVAEVNEYLRSIGLDEINTKSLRHGVDYRTLHEQALAKEISLAAQAAKDKAKAQNVVQAEVQKTSEVAQKADNEQLSSGQKVLANYERIVAILNEIVELRKIIKSGNRYLLPEYEDGRLQTSGGMYPDDIRGNRVTKVAIKDSLGLYNEYTSKGSDSLANNALNRLTACVAAYQNLDEAQELFGKKNQEVWNKVIANIEAAKASKQAYEDLGYKESSLKHFAKNGQNIGWTIGDNNNLMKQLDAGNIQGAIDMLVDRFGAVRESAADANAQVENLQQNIVEMNNQADTNPADEQMQKMGQEAIVTNEQISVLKTTLETLNSQLTTANSHLEKISVINISDEEFKKATDQISALEIKVTDLSSQLEAAKQELTQLSQVQTGDAAGKVEALEQNITELTSKLEAANQEIVRLQQGLNTSTDDTKVKELEGTISSLNQKIAEMQAKLDGGVTQSVEFQKLASEADAAKAKIEMLEQTIAELRAATSTVTGTVDIGNQVSVTGANGEQLALENTLQATYQIQQKMADTLTEINNKMVSGADAAASSYERLNKALSPVIAAIQAVNVAGIQSAATFDATNARIQELEANLAEAAQKYAELEEKIKKIGNSKKPASSSTDQTVDQTEERIKIEQKAAEIMKLSAESRIKIQKNLQEQIRKTMNLISTEYDQIRNMYQYINDFAYKTDSKSQAYTNALSAKNNLVNFNNSGSTDATKRAELEYAYQKAYQELVRQIGTSQSRSSQRMLNDVSGVATTATMDANAAIIEREIALTAELIQKNKELIASKQQQNVSNDAALARLNEIEILGKQYDTYIAKQKTVEDLKRRQQELIDNGAEENELINVNRQLSIAVTKLEKAEAFIKQAFSNDPVGAHIVSVQHLNEELERRNALNSDGSKLNAKQVKQLEGSYKTTVTSLRRASNGSIVNTAEGREIQDLVNKFKEYNNWLIAVDNNFNKLSDDQQQQIQESIDKFDQLTQVQQNALKSGAYNAYNKSGQYAGHFTDLSKNSLLSGLKGQIEAGILSQRDALEQVAASIAKTKLETVSYNEETGKLTATYRDQNKNMQQITIGFQDIGTSTRHTTKQIEQYQSIVSKAFGAIGSKLKELLRYFSSFTVIMGVWNSIKKGVQTVKELNTALTELQVVTQSNSIELDEFADKAKKVAKNIAATTTEVTQSATEWARLGYSMSDALDLAEVAASYSKVGFTDIGVATENLTATLQAFYSNDIKSGIISAGDAAAEITDKLVYVGNKFASSASGMGQGITAAGAALVAANNSLDESLAMITAGTTILQNEDETANALRTISLRLRGTKASELEEAGETDLSGVVEDASKLYSIVKKMTAVNGGKGVEIIDADTGAYKSTYQILLEISKVWDKMTDMQQAGLLETLAGKTRANAAAAILSNGDILEEAYEASQNAAGATQEAMEVALTSIESRIALFTQATETMWQNAISSDIVKFFVDLGTVIVELTDKVGLFSALFGGFLGFFGAKGQGKHANQGVS